MSTEADRVRLAGFVWREMPRSHKAKKNGVRLIVWDEKVLFLDHLSIAELQKILVAG